MKGGQLTEVTHWDPVAVGRFSSPAVSLTNAEVVHTASAGNRRGSTGASVSLVSRASLCHDPFST